MKDTGACWLVRDKRSFVLAIMKELARNAHMSFEGSLGRLRLASIPGASEEETLALKRNTIRPKQDFIVVPLEPSSEKTILSAIGGTLPRSIIHIQIEKAGILEFGAYDNFYPECIFLEAQYPRRSLSHLCLRGY
jgi:hypothetical protein